ncbi:MAG: biotin-dependent carboxyltransferase family protein [Actinomycetota bacterium]|nr:biotin-dependent carboxyltransferase family protein [Acidimicrobiia bacterium]MDQ3470502.1 biotin-dependent carboxyltransferase family protein [Actinomycetota bacterium]
MTTLTVVAPGWATTIQDGGRHGFAALGVPRSGALDADRQHLVNRLVGNDPDAAVLETAGGLTLRAGGPAVVATSAELVPRSVTDGDVIEVNPAAGELWGYVAVRGGVAVDAVLGSRSNDTLSGIGPVPLVASMQLPVGPDPGTPITTDQAATRPRPATLEVWPGPRVDWFADDALDVLTATAWTVTGDVSRIGTRLDGPPLRRRRTDELPSEGLVLGAIQVPADGRPLVMLADHPTTGGYPVLAVVDSAHVGAVAQSRPGATIRFRLHRR